MEAMFESLTEKISHQFSEKFEKIERRLQFIEESKDIVSNEVLMNFAKQNSTPSKPTVWKCIVYDMGYLKTYHVIFRYVQCSRLLPRHSVTLVSRRKDDSCDVSSLRTVQLRMSPDRHRVLSPTYSGRLHWINGRRGTRWLAALKGSLWRARVVSTSDERWCTQHMFCTHVCWLRNSVLSVCAR